MRRVLLDENLDPELARLLPDYIVSTVAQMGWRSIQNGELLKLARLQFDVFLSLDRGIPFQHRHEGHDLIIGVIRVPNSRVETVAAAFPQVLAFLSSAQPGTVAQIDGWPKGAGSVEKTDPK